MSKTKTKKRAKTPRYRLTVSKDKLAVLLRLPKSTVKIVDQMAKDTGNGAKRTTVLYGIIGDHPKLTESMQPLLIDLN